MLNLVQHFFFITLSDSETPVIGQAFQNDKAVTEMNQTAKRLFCFCKKRKFFNFSKTI